MTESVTYYVIHSAAHGYYLDRMVERAFNDCWTECLLMAEPFNSIVEAASYADTFRRNGAPDAEVCEVAAVARSLGAEK